MFGPGEQFQCLENYSVLNCSDSYFCVRGLKGFK